MKQMKLKIQGITPMIHHSERLANPFDPLSRSLKKLTAKRGKTETDLLEIARVEWEGGLYYDTDAGRPCVPGYNLLAAAINGGKIRKLGTAVKRAVLVLEDKVPMLYDGPRDIDSMFSDKNFVDVRSVKVGTAKVARCRPIFKNWALEFTVVWDDSVLQEDQLLTVFSDTGAMVGIGDYRPRFGRFEVVGHA